MSKPLGIVVVGLGRAGKARVRDITTNVLGENIVKLIGVVSRHKPEDVKETFLSWDEALGRSDVDAFVIATENGNHEECAKKCLDAGKHILVDFPLTISSQSAKDIIELAEKKGLVCQEEDIGLLTPAFKELIQMLESKPPVSETTMVFTASSQSSSWIGDLKRAGFPSFSGINRLHMVYEMFGELTVKEAKLTRDGDSIEMVASLLTKDNRPIIWINSRSPGKDRTFSFDFKFEDGTTMSYSPRMGPPPRGAAPPPTGPPMGPPKGLFAGDLKLFIDKVRGEVAAEELAKERKRVLHCLELAGKIEEMATGGN
ncbi:biliverdin reductase A-like [Actinia tenebrosa]|uniref:Biliverdin reductase A-like n=1 Tax=Actinia tenebrosa TaxID=6105 RepID=A0A6P8HCP8_ACTTE|nr:biliverdin reductase A-like [Actinia tenebrosa]